MLFSAGAGTGLPARLARIAAAATLPCALADEPDLGIAPAIEASPMTWTFSALVEAKVMGSTGHHPLSAERPADRAMAPARCGGMRLTTSPFWLPKPHFTVIAAGSTLSTLPPSLPAIQAIMPGNSCSHAAWNSPCFEKLSLASNTRIFDLGFLALK